MEYINNIELRGVVGTARLQAISNDVCANFSLMVEHSSKDSHGLQTVECNWFSVSAFQSKVGADIDKVGKGSHVYVKGRLRFRQYTDAFGQARVLPEVVAHLVNICHD